MKHIAPIGRTPVSAQQIALDDKIQYVIAIFDIVIPLVTNKNPQNPLPPESGGTPAA